MLNLAYELKPRGIAVAVVNPGPVDTDMMKGARMPLQAPAAPAGRRARPPVGRSPGAGSGRA